jgi:integrase
MATFRPHGKGIQAEVNMRGVRRARTFESKGAARAWAHALEAEIMAGFRGEVPDLTLAELFSRYSAEVSTTKKGKRWEQVRLEALGRDKLAQVRLRNLDTPHVADWQQRRLQDVAASTVRRERNLLNNVFEIGRKEWRWLQKNPFVGVRRPKDGKHRDRIASPEELQILHDRASPALSRAIHAAVETGMRESEIASNPPIIGRVATLADTKNGTSREVPLSEKGLEVLSAGITLTADSISQLFARLCDRDDVKIADLTFHDLRHTAATRIAKKMPLLDLCKMFGWKDPRMAMRYYKSNAQELAVLL